MINKFDKFKFKAKVDINNAQRIFVIFRNTVENQKTKEIISTKYFFGRQMSGNKQKNNKLINQKIRIKIYLILKQSLFIKDYLNLKKIKKKA